nr:glycosyltransferase [Cellulomonas denverensis]
MVTASRLAEEKHLDVLVRAVTAARATLPGLHLDIYGEGDRTGLTAAIAETGTQDCVRLLGHRDLTGVLGRYALYVSASTSEGFGLSLLEALTEGLPVIGFDVDYGNRELIRPGVNGHLVPTTPGAPLRDVPALARAIVDTLTSGTLDHLRRGALDTATEYSADRVRRQWELLLAGEAPC